MGNGASGSSQKILTSVIGGAVLLLLGYVISSMGERYRASEAERDFKQIRAEIELSEKRTKELLAEHKTAGPHDDVAVRLGIMEANYTKILEEIRELKAIVRDDDN